VVSFGNPDGLVNRGGCLGESSVVV
jgi:hypothetical protein